MPSPVYRGRIYPGLRPFDTEDAVLFFGREEQTDELLRRLEGTRFLAIVGLSGSGKSSLVRAGLLPSLRRGHLSDAGANWRVAVLRPGSDPIGALCQALNSALGPRENRATTLRSGPLGLVDASRHGRLPQENLLLVVDQFEELFRFHASSRNGNDEPARFVDLLLGATRDYEPDFRTYVVLTIRSDYLGECARFVGLPEALNESQYLVPRMTRSQLREAIVGPAALGGVVWDEVLLSSLLDQTGDNPDQLPVLQHLLMRMWETREGTPEGHRIGTKQLEAAGGWGDALNAHADEIWNHLGQRQATTKRVFQRLTEGATAGREMRRPSTVSELSKVAGASIDELTKVIDRFRGEGCDFLTSADLSLTASSVIDISHESLIRRWTRLNDWTKEEADWGKWYQRVADRLAVHGAPLAGAELEAALQARTDGGWSEAWASRYDVSCTSYDAVMGFLDESQRRRSDEVHRLRRARVLAALLALAFAGLFVVASLFGFRANQAGHRAEAAGKEAKKSADLANQKRVEADQVRAKIAEALAALRLESERTTSALANAKGSELVALAGAVDDDPQLSLEAARTAWDHSGSLSPTLRGTIYKSLAKNFLRMEISHPTEVHGVTFSPDGLEIRAMGDDIRVWDSATGRLLRTFGKEGNRGLSALSPDGTKFVVASLESTTASVWDVLTNRPVFALSGHTDRIVSVIFSPDGKQIATTSHDDGTLIWSTATGELLFRLQKGDDFRAGRLALFHTTRNEIVTRSFLGRLHFWSTETGRHLRELDTGGGGADPPLALSSDGTRALTAIKGETAVILDPQTGERLASLVGHTAILDAVAFSPRGEFVATGSRDGTIRVWDVITGKNVVLLEASLSITEALNFSPDGGRLVSAHPGGRILVWDLSAAAARMSIRHPSEPSSAVFASDGQRILTSANEGVRMWDALTGQLLFRIAGTFHGPAPMSPNDRLFAAIQIRDNKSSVELRESETGNLIRVLPCADGDYFLSASFSPDGTRIATTSNRFVQLWEVSSGEEMWSRGIHTHDNAYFSPSGTVIVTGHSLGSLQFWDARTGDFLGERKMPSINTFAFHPDGRLFASDGYWPRVNDPDRIPKIEVADLRGVKSLSFSPDGRLGVFTRYSDRTVQVEDFQTYTSVQALTGHQADVNSAVFSPDGRSIVTASDDGNVNIWSVHRSVADLRKTLNESIIRTLDTDDCRLPKVGACPPMARPAMQSRLEAWARTQVSLGNQRSGTAAVAAFGHARKIFSRNQYKSSWENLTWGMATNSTGEQARTLFEELLKSNPEHPGMLEYASLLHDELFDFPKAASIMERFAVRHLGDNFYHSNYAEILLSVGDFRGCIDQSNKALAPGNSWGRLLVRAACEQALDNRTAAAATITIVLAASPDSYRWDGTRRYISQSPLFGSNREAWLAVLDSYSQERTPAFVAALKRLTATLR